MAKLRTYRSIQYLRAIAALGVVGFHAGATGLIGQAGVDVFFVISGFIMFLVTKKETTPKEFILHRILRIWPLYLLATIVMAIHNQVGLWDFAQSALFIPYFDAAGNPWPVLVQGWTLNYEMFFYCLMAASLFLPGNSRKFSALTTSILALTMFGLLTRPQGAILQVYTGPLLLEFLAGLWIGWGMSRLDRLGGGAGMAMIGVAIFGLFLSRNFDGDAHWRALVWGVPSALLVAGALVVEGAGKMIEIPVLKFLGDASYSIYLFHPFILKTAERLLGALPAPLVSLGEIAAAALVGGVAYLVIEKPITKVLRDRVFPRRPPGLPEAKAAG